MLFSESWRPLSVPLPLLLFGPIVLRLSHICIEAALAQVTPLSVLCDIFALVCFTARTWLFVFNQGHKSMARRRFRTMGGRRRMAKLTLGSWRLAY